MQAGIQKLPKDLDSYLESHVTFAPPSQPAFLITPWGLTMRQRRLHILASQVKPRLREGELLVFMRLACAKDEILRYHQSTGFLSMQRQRMIRWPKNLKTWL
jgi:hypothetical protein